MKSYIVSAGDSITLRLRLENKPGTLAGVTAAIGELGGNIGSIDIVRVEKNALIRDVAIETAGQEHIHVLVDKIETLPGVQLLAVADRTFDLHSGGKIEVRSKVKLRSRDQLSRAYTPGVARVCTAIQDDPERAYQYTIKGTTVAVVTDGSAVLGLGDIGPQAAIPVMEGKAMLFKEFAGVNAFPICLDTKDVDEIVEAVVALAPVFGGINLEDISAPRCFEIERRLRDRLDIPVFHDDQHGTAVVASAALINALRIVEKRAEDLKVVVLGVGAAGTAITDMLLELGVRNIVGLDRRGALVRDDPLLTREKQRYAERTNPHGEAGCLSDVIADADVLIGVAAPGTVTVDDLRQMARDPIVFALANPDPEILPEEAYPHVAVMATGRSDYPNQINNVLCFPGLFKGALACRAKGITEAMKLAAAHAIAETIPRESIAPDHIVPSVFDKRVTERVAHAVTHAVTEA